MFKCCGLGGIALMDSCEVGGSSPLDTERALVNCQSGVSEMLGFLGSAYTFM